MAAELPWAEEMRDGNTGLSAKATEFVPESQWDFLLRHDCWMASSTIIQDIYFVLLHESILIVLFYM